MPEYEASSSSVDDAFDEDWRHEVESRVRDCSSMSNSCGDGVLDGDIGLTEIARCLHSLKIIRLEGVME